MTILLSSAYQPGKCLNHKGNVIRLLERRGSLGMFPGGRGISEWEAEEIPVPARYPMTVFELDLLEMVYKTNG